MSAETKTTHTPGPWWWQSAEGGPYEDETADPFHEKDSLFDRAVALPKALRGEGGYDVLRYDVEEDDAGLCQWIAVDREDYFLIAAAPDLLAACRTALEAMPPDQSAIHALENAIRKAEGREE